MADMNRPGPSGQFPQGKLRPDDKGGLAVAVSRRGDQVFIDFGTAVTWLALPASDCESLAVVLLKQAGVKNVIIDGRQRLAE
jgi:hypothetical protein